MQQIQGMQPEIFGPIHDNIKRLTKDFFLIKDYFVYSRASKIQKILSSNFHYNGNFLRNETGTLQNKQSNVGSWRQGERDSE